MIELDDPPKSAKGCRNCALWVPMFKIQKCDTVTRMWGKCDGLYQQYDILTSQNETCPMWEKPSA